MFRRHHTVEDRPGRWLLSTLLFVLILLLFVLMPRAQSASAGPETPSQLDWLEPRGLTVVDLVGLVPEEQLRDAIVAYRPGSGIAQYISGQRNGNTVTIRTRMTPRYWLQGTQMLTRVNCLGQLAVYDEWPGVMPAGKMRVYANDVEVTNQAIYHDHTPAGQILPTGNTTAYLRYPQQSGEPSFHSDGSLNVPANMGCAYFLSGQYTNIITEFTVEDSAHIRVTTLGSESFVFHSYIGVGNGGQLDSLRDQMTKRFGSRHDKFTLNPPSGTEYFFVKYPPTPAEAYPDTLPGLNTPLPSSGTYRIGRSNNALSVDHVNSMAMPLYGQWQDADQSGAEYLPFFSDGVQLATPEYFLPAGVPYEPCMTNGGCTPSLLDQVHNTEMTITIYYYRIDRVVNNLTRIPLRQVGRSWRPGQLQAQASARLDVDAATIPNCDAGNCVYLPIINAPPPTPTAQPTPIPTPTIQVAPDDPTGCPCGWFDNVGRMVDYIAPP